jgi:tetratricopeptide (TPR) repeat protein
MIPSASLTELNNTVDGLEQGITAMVKDISVQIRSDQRILAFTEQKKFWQTAVAAGEQEERTGDRLKGLELYMRAWRGRPRPELEQQLQSKIANLVKDLKTLPPISEEARRYGVQATSQVEKKRYEEAIKLYEKALDIAPWWAEGHYNRALVLADQQRYSEAVTALKAFLLLAANTPEARVVQDKIYEWEIEAQQQSKAGAVQQSQISGESEKAMKPAGDTVEAVRKSTGQPRSAFGTVTGTIKK